MVNLKDIHFDWCLFLDRDGVINYEKQNDYIYNFSEFKFYEGVKEAMAIFASKFGKIFIVTNQRGIEKGLMTETDLHEIHKYMLIEMEKVGATIHGIYYCSSLDDNHPDRKPQHGMALQAQADFPDIDFNKCIMVGNKMSDMKFGRNAGMHTVYVQTTHPDQSIPDPAIDFAFKDLLNFAQAL